MNNSELEKKLRAAHEPKFPADYPADFSRAVFAGLRASHASRLTPHASHHWQPRLAWGLAVALLVIAGFGLRPSRHREVVVAAADLLENAQLTRETLALFPNQLRAITQDEHGLKLELAERADVPDSPPLFVRICDGKNCFSAVTFSGQEISVAGKKLTVLAEADGGIILTGEQFAWSSSAPNASRAGLEIKAKAL